MPGKWDCQLKPGYFSKFKPVKSNLTKILFGYHLVLSRCTDYQKCMKLIYFKVAFQENGLYHELKKAPEIHFHVRFL